MIVRDTKPQASREELVIAELWAEALEVPEVGLDENFFAMGGHSLSAVKVAGRMCDLFDVDVPLDILFESPTVRAVAKQVQTRRAGRRVKPAPGIVRRDDGVVSLSFSQERIWFHEQARPGTAVYNQPWALRLQGTLDVEALGAALNGLAARHDTLRMVFPAENGRPVPVRLREVAIPVPIEDLSGLPAADREQRAEDLLQEHARRPFDVARGPLVRARLFKLGSAEHILLLTTHHLVCDGVSWEILAAELSVRYRAFRHGKPAGYAEPALSFGDVAGWQREVLTGEVQDEAVRYFRRELDGAPALLELPVDRPAPAEPSHRGATCEFAIPAVLTTRLRGLAREHGVTLFVVLLAGLQTMLHRYTGQSDIVVGTTSANRDRPESGELVGPLFNTLALRAAFSDATTFASLMGELQRRTLGAFARQEVPFELIVEQLALDRDHSYSPLFQVLFELNRAFLGEPPEGLAWSSRLVDTGTSKVELAFVLSD
ncbi:condensation domain-containing protein, partial [Amycolatopsis lurida]|uniref:condensation domain-containing protein n=1 Tax=Amycolatopsis lurida TaxID=31959 RepID=UPI003660FC0B